MTQPVPGRVVRAAERLVSVGFKSPAVLVAWTIGLGTGVRLLLAAIAPDLGHSEAYYIAASRHLAWSYLDHPPLSFWIAWATMKLLGSDALLVVRIPFILAFAATTWILFRLTSSLFGEAAGAFAALLLNLSPLFAISVGAWVQPDGPLMLFILAASTCVVRLARERGSGQPISGWVQAGVWLGLALLSKYHAVLLPVGVALFASTSREHRRWFREPGPYIACGIAIVLASPVLVWNWQNDWISFWFQAHRAVETHGLAPRYLLDSLVGQAALVGPWIWVPILIASGSAVRRGLADSASWLLLWLGGVPIGLFTAIALWVPADGHYHWQGTGYLLLFPLLGRFVAEKLEGDDLATRRWLFASTAAICLVALVICAEAETGWIHQRLRRSFGTGNDFTLKGLEWRELRTAVAARGLLAKPRLFVVTAHRVEVGKVDVELGRYLPVVCLCPDPRDAAFSWDPRDFVGWDALVVGTKERLPDARREYGAYFRTIAALDDVAIHRGGSVVLNVQVHYAEDYRGSYPLPYGKARSSR